MGLARGDVNFPACVWLICISVIRERDFGLLGAEPLLLISKLGINLVACRWGSGQGSGARGS